MTATLIEGTSVRAVVPASSANLGPGFDTLGLALGLYDEITVTAVRSGLAVRVDGEGASEVPWGPSHLVVRAIERGLEAAGVWANGLEVVCHNRIPHSRGLGSSASAAVGGLSAANALVAAVDPSLMLAPDTLVQLASEFEGHPDNASASFLGGAVVSWSREVGPTEGPRHFAAVRLDVHPDLGATVLIPGEKSSTAHTRGLLPDLVPHRDAAFTASRSALAVVALTSRPDLLHLATEDRLHQPYRAEALPTTTRWVRTLRDHGHAATVSGAGPTVLVLGTESLSADLRTQAEDDGMTVLELDIADAVESSLVVD
ncbi:homoserine kinase [Rhodococcoides kroppenstedtii]|uniref:homoserine kinase n=1 Tax=Rhodococcoides kroppenstedtii TaxID=293050 RepID=UPI003645097F